MAKGAELLKSEGAWLCFPSFQVSPSSGSSDNGQPHGMAMAGYTSPLAALSLTKPCFSVTSLHVKLKQTLKWILRRKEKKKELIIWTLGIF